jgi:hypothetical protein
VLACAGARAIDGFRCALPILQFLTLRRSMPFTPLRPFCAARRSSWYQRGLIREPLRKIRVILLHDVEHRFPGERAMVLGKEPVHLYELFIGHGRRAWP